MKKDLDYENSNIAYDSQYTEENGGGIKCKNYIICECILPTWWFDCKGSYLCTGCHIAFGSWKSGERTYTGKGILTVIENAECPICLEIKKCISQPRCEHSACISCFKRCYFGDESGEPTFPYSDIEDEYYDDQKNPKWSNDYPLIKIYNEEWNKWDDDKIYKYENEEHLRCCSVCRK